MAVMEEGWKEVGIDTEQNSGPKRVPGKVDLTQDYINLEETTAGNAAGIMRKMNRIRKQYDEKYENDEDEKGAASTRNSPMKGRLKGKGAKMSMGAGDDVELERTDESEKYAAFRN